MPTPSRFAASVIAAKPTAELRIPQPRRRPANTPAQAELGRGTRLSYSFRSYLFLDAGLVKVKFQEWAMAITILPLRSNHFPIVGGRAELVTLASSS
jgi:hypothetical protein